MRHISRAILTLSVVVALIATALPGAETPGDEAQFVSLINQSRAAAGLAGLAVYADLTDDARIHTADMVAAGQVFHSTGDQLGSYASGWALLGENVGMGPNPSLLHQAFMNSDSHRANILGDYDLLGVGVARSPQGVMFVTVVFMKSAAPATTTTTAPPSTTTIPPPTTSTVPVTTTEPTTTTTVPVTTTTAPPTTTTTPPAPTTTLDASSATPAPTEPGPEQSGFEATTGSQPAAKVAGAVNDRTFVAFRPVFSLLSTAGSDPLVRFTTNGIPVTIE